MKKVLKTTIILIILFITQLNINKVFAIGPGLEASQTSQSLVDNAGGGEQFTYSPSWFDDVCTKGEDFISTGEAGAGDVNTLAETNANIFNVLSTIGMVLSVAIGGSLGIKYMIASIEDKAKIKETMTPYIVGCIVVFGAFAIWRMVIIALDGI